MISKKGSVTLRRKIYSRKIDPAYRQLILTEDIIGLASNIFLLSGNESKLDKQCLIKQ